MNSRYSYLTDGVHGWFQYQRVRADWPGKHGPRDCRVTLTAPPDTLEIAPTACEWVAAGALISLAQRKTFGTNDLFYLSIADWAEAAMNCQTPDEIGRLVEDYARNWEKVRVRR